MTHFPNYQRSASDALENAKARINDLLVAEVQAVGNDTPEPGQAWRVGQLQVLVSVLNALYLP